MSGRLRESQCQLREFDARLQNGDNPSERVARDLDLVASHALLWRVLGVQSGAAAREPRF